MAYSANKAFDPASSSLMENLMSDDDVTGIHHVDAMDHPESFLQPQQSLPSIKTDYEHYKKRLDSCRNFLPDNWQQGYDSLEFSKKNSWTQRDYSILLVWVSAQAHQAGMAKPIAQNKESVEILLTDIKRMTSGFTEMKLKMEKLEQEVRATKTIQVEKPVVHLPGVQVEPFNVDWVINLFSILYVKDGTKLGHPMMTYKEKMKQKPAVVQQWLKSLKGKDSDGVEEIRKLAAELSK